MAELWNIKNLDRGSVRCACAYRSRGSDTFVKPEWLDEHNLDKPYTPSNNIAPTDITPVLVSATKYRPQGDAERVLKPMMWGMVPPWHKGQYNKHGLSTNNCRLEGILSSKLYGTALREGGRCVILAEGFYEWQTTAKSVKTKQPYFIYAPQDEGVRVDDPTSWNNQFDNATGWRGINLLKMAGLYSIWGGPSNPLYSYSVITLESNSTLDWLHHRMPAILDTEELIEKWLDIENINAEVAVSLLRPVERLSWHPVSTLVNNSRIKSTECNKRVALDKKEKRNATASQKIMNAWLTGKVEKRKSDECQTNAKRVKTE